MTRRAIHALGILAALAAGSVTARAQDPRFPLKFDEPSRIAILAIYETAKTQGLPLSVLQNYVEEGQSKGADGPRIVVGLRLLTQEMSDAHKALGAVASADELKAAANAMHAGVPAVELGKFKKEGWFGRSLVRPFTVLSDMVSRGVPVNTAISAVRSLVSAGAKDADLADLQRNVKDDIQQGASPAAAAETRAKQAEKKPDQDRSEL